MVKLDKKDKKILNCLDLDARQTNSGISKKVGLSKKGVEYRLQRLQEENVIGGYYPIIDFFRLGFEYHRVFIKLAYLDSSLIRKLEKYISSTDDINWAVWFKGEYDLGIAFWTKTPSEFKQKFLNFFITFEKNIHSIYHSQVTELNHFAYGMFSLKPAKLSSISDTNNYIELDDLDKKILFVLNANSRLNSTEIAFKTGSNYKVISYRLKRLKENGILLTSRPKINHIVLGYTHYKVFAFLSISDNSVLKKFVQFISSLQQTIYHIDQVEVQFVDFELMCLSVQEFNNLLLLISDNFPGVVKEYQSFIFGSTLKISYLPPQL